MLLIRKGITTYEYVVAMRAQDEPQASEKIEKKKLPVQASCLIPRDWWNPNSAAVPFHGAWCNPRRPKQPGEGISGLDKRKLPCTVDTESTTVIERTGHSSSRHIVKISALKLAMLNSKEAVKAATKARENCSIFRLVGFHSFHTSDTDCGSSCNITPRSSVNLDYGPRSSRKGSSEDTERSLQANQFPRPKTNKGDKDIYMVSSRSSSSGSAPLSPLPVERRFGNPNVLETSNQSIQSNDMGAARHGL